MSAQLPPEAKPNGVAPQSVQRQPEAPEPAGRGVQQAEGAVQSELQQHAQGAGPGSAAPLEMRRAMVEEPPRAAETIPALAQARHRTEALTMPDADGRSELENVSATNTAVNLQSGFFTPTAAATVRGPAANPSWRGNMEVPRWMVRLSNFLNTGVGTQAVDIAPSPLPGGSPLYSTPPGGHPFRLRSPSRARAIPPVPTPPSSSSVPAEAIQAEVQRQLRGMTEQLRLYERKNHQLQQELDEVRGSLQSERERRQVYVDVLLYLRVLMYLEVRALYLVPQNQEVEVMLDGREVMMLRYQYLLLPHEQGVQQLQELQAQALSKASTTGLAEVVKPGTIVLTKMPEVKDGADSALTFQDWLEISTSVMSDISEGSGEWWSGVMTQVEETYERWLTASPLERLAVEPADTDLWTTGKWNRVNARGASMILSAMTDSLKTDVVARRNTQNCVKMMFRAYTYYQPGGGAERQDMLRRLQNPVDYVGGDTADQVLQVVRSWPRWMERCNKVRMTPPDASVLARGLTVLTEKYINLSTDASFRTSMLRASLRLDARPTVLQVQAYQRHLQAELEALIASGTGQGAPLPKLKAVDAPLQPKARDAGGKGASGSEVCRYFAKASGCKRGERCSYAHTMAGMDKEVRAKKCLKCGAESHRAKDCPIGKAIPKTTATSTATPQPKDQSIRKPQAAQQDSASLSTMATSGTTSTASTMGDVIQGSPWTLEALFQAAQQVVQTQTSESASDTSPEKTRPQMKVLHLRDIRICSTKATATALVDSGATHGLRTATSAAEWEAAEEISVQLAGHHQLVMRITPGGTLLMPPRKVCGRDPAEPAGQTIVPMGELIRTLGYSMFWSAEECYLEEPSGRRIPLQTEGGCPQMCEMEALAVIARLEDRRLEELKNATLLTRDRVGLAAVSMEKTWDAFLLDYVGTGSFESGLRAVRDAPFFRDLPGECLRWMIPTAGLWCGWDIMKESGCFTRAQRRRILTSKRWVVHLFAGREGHYEVMKLDQGDTIVLEIDVARSQGLDLLRSEVWRMLLWGAKEGKIDAVIGGPPGRAQQHANGGERDVRSVSLIARMLWLHAMAQVGRELNGGAYNHNREVAFMLEYPEGITPETRALFEEEILRAEGASRVPRGKAGPATWTETQTYWETVQRPRLERLKGRPTMDASASFWDTRMWKLYQQREGLRLVSFDQGATGGGSRNRTTLGTNIASLLSLDGLRVPEDDPMPETSSSDYIWSQGLVNAVVVALSFWDRDPRCAPRLPRVQAMSAAQWKRHVEGNHEVYRKDCVTCVTARGIGRQHRKIHHPEAYVLTADVAGPIAPGLDPTSKGATGKNIKYLLVAKYVVPKAYVEQHFGKAPPPDDGIPVGDAQKDKKGEELFPELFGDDALEVDDPEASAEVVHVPEKGSPDLLDDLEEYEPSLPGDGDPEGEIEEENPSKNLVMQHGDTSPPELTYLTFAVGLTNNQAGTVKRGLQDIVLYLQMHGFPVYRFHSDKGEFYNHQLRAWLREQGVFGTWSEPGVPQSNGRAEATVRWVKDSIRTYLASASLPVRLWPTAAEAVTAAQRAKVLGWKSHLAAPYGATVHLRKKAFDKYGPLKRENTLESKWHKGVYVGLSSILHHGHLVYVPGDGVDKEKFFHTLHVRPNLVDPGQPEVELRADDKVKPRRRVTEKTSPAGVEMKKLKAENKDLGSLATSEAAKLLQSWDVEEAKELVVQLAREGFFDAQKFGVFRHGGTVGWMTGLLEYPEVSKMLARVVKESCPLASFTSILVSCNVSKAIHKDFNNDYQTKNYVVPLTVPESGGELWVELKEGDVVQGHIERRESGGKQVYGQLHSLRPGEAIEFSPARYHEVMDWTGERVVIIAYTPNCLGKLSQEDLQQLHDHDFPVPLSQLPEFHGSMTTEPLPVGVRQVQVPWESEPEFEALDAGDHGWSMYLDLEPGLVKIADYDNKGSTPRISKAEVGYTRNIEDVLKKLTAPLDVVHNVSPDEVMSNLEEWRGAITKEVQGVSVAIERLSPGSPSRRRWLNLPKAQRLPMKFVFTVKPNDGAKLDQPETWFKRKARLVICGNMAKYEEASLYAETAPAEAVRMALTVASKNQWLIAILDIVAAFLKTPLGRLDTDPVVVAQPPRLLEALGLIEPMELWGLIRALYGLREAPMLWTNYRDSTMKMLRAPAGLSWYQGKAITSWWTLRDKDGRVCGIVVVYVDDYMVCGPRDVVCEVSKIIQEVWDTSELTFLGPGSSVRFLGMELHRETESSDVITVFQKGYILELLRSHSIKPTQLDRIPITKELSLIPEEIEEATNDQVRQAQQLTGEALWVSQRTRPDLSYTTSMMASLCTRSPSQVVAIGNKVLGYLQRTMGYGLKIQWEGKGLVMYCDAAYAPQGDRSHGGWVVTYGGIPIVWRSGRQQMVTLSTAESELLSMIDGAVAMMGVESLLADIGEQVTEREIVKYNQQIYLPKP
ncbi:RE1 [Symbiodinium sp. CCMP2592]|nr:RE1 [Symbiodinium sp. CCMP2592]